MNRSVGFLSLVWKFNEFWNVFIDWANLKWVWVFVLVLLPFFCMLVCTQHHCSDGKLLCNPGSTLYHLYGQQDHTSALHLQTRAMISVATNDIGTLLLGVWNKYSTVTLHQPWFRHLSYIPCTPKCGNDGQLRLGYEDLMVMNKTTFVECLIS